MFVDYSRPIAKKIAAMQIELCGKTDLRFVEAMYKVNVAFFPFLFFVINYYATLYLGSWIMHCCLSVYLSLHPSVLCLLEVKNESSSNSRVGAKVDHVMSS